MEKDQVRDVGYAKLDMTRCQRTGCSETVYCPGKNSEQLAGIFEAFREGNVPVLGTKCAPEMSRVFLRNRDLSDWSDKKAQTCLENALPAVYISAEAKGKSP